MVVNIDPQLPASLKTAKTYFVIVCVMILNLVKKGKAHKLLRKALMRDENKAKDKRQKELYIAFESISDLENEIEDLKKELMCKEREIERFNADRSILEWLYDQGVINEEGDLLIPNLHSSNSNVDS